MFNNPTDLFLFIDAIEKRHEKTIRLQDELTKAKAEIVRLGHIIGDMQQEIDAPGEPICGDSQHRHVGSCETYANQARIAAAAGSPPPLKREDVIEQAANPDNVHEAEDLPTDPSVRN